MVMYIPNANIYDLALVGDNELFEKALKQESTTHSIQLL